MKVTVKTEIKQIKFNFGQGDCVKCAEVPDESCKYYGEPDGCNFRSLANILRKAEVCEMIDRETTREKSSQVGNAAKMREALRQVSRVAVEMTRKTATGEPEDRKTVDEWALRLCDIVSATLAAPPRNCDVGTAEEQSMRYEALCDSHTCGSRCSASGCPMYEYDCSPFAWGQMPYEEGGAK